MMYQQPNNMMGDDQQVETFDDLINAPLHHDPNADVDDMAAYGDEEMLLNDDNMQHFGEDEESMAVQDYQEEDG